MRCWVISFKLSAKPTVEPVPVHASYFFDPTFAIFQSDPTLHAIATTAVYGQVSKAVGY